MFWSLLSLSAKGKGTNNKTESTQIPEGFWLWRFFTFDDTDIWHSDIELGMRHELTMSLLGLRR